MNNPVLLFLHGGPGMPMMYMAHKFQEQLEDNFVVVQWDQRSSGKSFKKDLDKETINVRQYLDDAKVVVELLKKRFNKDKIILAGHSWGSYLGTLLMSEDAHSFHAYVGIGQVVDDQLSQEIQKEFLENTARERDDLKALSEIQEKGVAVYENYLFKYGGELKNHKSFMPFVWAGLGSPEYTWKDVFSVAKGSSTASAHMKYNVINGSLLKNAMFNFDIPVFYFTGKHDYTTPFSLVEQYYNQVNAPHKQMFWFENSSHFPFFEEPEAFAAAMLEVKNYLKKIHMIE